MKTSRGTSRGMRHVSRTMKLDYETVSLCETSKCYDCLDFLFTELWEFEKTASEGTTLFNKQQKKSEIALILMIDYPCIFCAEHDAVGRFSRSILVFEY